MLAYVNRIIDIRDGMIDLKRREVGGDLFDAEIEDIDRDTIEGLREGLPPEVRLRLNLRRNMTVQVVIDDALYVEKLIEWDYRKHRSFERSNARVDPRLNRGQETTEVGQAPTPSQPTQEGQKPVLEKARIQCYYCKNFGHYKSDCRKLAFVKNQDQNQGNGQLVTRQGANVTNAVLRSVKIVETVTESSSTSSNYVVRDRARSSKFCLKILGNHRSRR